MMLRQGWAFESSPHGASQTIFRPGMSGVPDERAITARSGVCAAADTENAKAQTASASARRFMSHGPMTDLNNTAGACSTRFLHANR
jgi:hypothetical protein